MQYLGFFMILAVIGTVSLILFSPMLKGWRTQIFNSALAVVGAVIPVMTEWVDFLRILDWRTYLLANDKRNLAVVGVIAALALTGIILRAITTGPVGEK